jgi:hypothetical protein
MDGRKKETGKKRQSKIQYGILGVVAPICSLSTGVLRKTDHNPRPVPTGRDRIKNRSKQCKRRARHVKEMRY